MHHSRIFPPTYGAGQSSTMKRHPNVTHVLIAGGGLTGSALAIHLGRLGLSVELFEHAHFPREKPCGEGLMPATVAAIERLGLNARAGAPFEGVRYHFRDRVVEGRFPKVSGLPRLGRGLRRRELDNTLFELAKRTPNVKVHTRALVEAPLVESGRVVGLIVNGAPQHGDLIVGADGARSRLRHALTLDLPARRKRVGVCTHFRLTPGRAVPKSVDVYLGHGYELYATPLPGGELLVAALAGAEALHSRLEDQFRRWCSAQHHLAERLDGAERTGDLLAVSPVSGRARQRFLPGFVLLGDAAGFSDPITGGGMTQALLSAELLSQYVARHARAAAEHWLGDFDREREALLRNYRRLTTLILWLTKHQASLRIALEAMRRLPKLFSHLLGVAGSAHQFENAEFKYGNAASQSQCLARTP